LNTLESEFLPMKVSFRLVPLRPSMLISVSYSTTFTSLSGDYRIDSLLGGQKWRNGIGTGVTLTYSLHGAASTYDPQARYHDDGPYTNPVTLSETTKVAIRLALNKWAKVANITFTELADTGASSGILRFGASGSATVTGANESTVITAYTIPPTAASVGGDMWFSKKLFACARRSWRDPAGETGKATRRNIRV
jgi:serralysin